MITAIITAILKKYRPYVYFCITQHVYIVHVGYKFHSMTTTSVCDCQLLVLWHVKFCAICRQKPHHFSPTVSHQHQQSLTLAVLWRSRRKWVLPVEIGKACWFSRRGGAVSSCPASKASKTQSMVGRGRHGRLTGYKFCVRSFHGKWLDDVHAGFLWISVVHYITSHTHTSTCTHTHT